MNGFLKAQMIRSHLSPSFPFSFSFRKKKKTKGKKRGKDERNLGRRLARVEITKQKDDDQPFLFSFQKEKENKGLVVWSFLVLFSTYGRANKFPVSLLPEPWRTARKIISAWLGKDLVGHSLPRNLLGPTVIFS